MTNETKSSNKKPIVIGIALAVAAGGYLGVDTKYKNSVSDEISKIETTMLEQGLEITHESIDANLFDDDITVNNILVKDKEESARSISVEQLVLNRKTLLETNDDGVPNEFDLSVINATITNAVEGVAAAVAPEPIALDLEYRYKFDPVAKTYSMHNEIDVKKYFALNVDVNLTDADSLWSHVSKNTVDGKPAFEFETQEAAEAALGKVAVKDFNVSIKDAGALELAAGVGVMVGVAQTTNDVRTSFANDLLPQIPYFQPESAKSIKEFALDGGTLSAVAKPVTPVEIVKLFKSIDVNQPQAAAVKVLRDGLNFSIVHTPSTNLDVNVEVSQPVGAAVSTLPETK